MSSRKFLILTTLALGAAGALLACVSSPTPSGTSGGPTEHLPTEVPSPVVVTPTPPADAGRPDCAADLAAYEDPDGYLSLCYPVDWRATMGEPQGDFGHTFSLRSPDASPEDTASAYLITYWSRSTSQGCAVWQGVEAVTLTLAGQGITACTGDVIDTEGDNPGPPFFRGTYAEIPIGPDNGFVVLTLIERTDISPAHATLLSGILDSLQVAR